MPKLKIRGPVIGQGLDHLSKSEEKEFKKKKGKNMSYFIFPKANPDKHSAHQGCPFIPWNTTFFLSL